MDVEPIEAIVGVALIGAALVGVVMLRPQVQVDVAQGRYAVARSAASVLGYAYVRMFAYSPNPASDVNQTLAEWADAISRDSGLMLRVNLSLSNGSAVVGSAVVFDNLNRSEAAGLSIAEKPCPVYVMPNGTVLSEIVFEREWYNASAQSGTMDPLRLMVVYYDARNGLPIENSSVTVSAKFECMEATTCAGRCANPAVCSLIDPTLEGNATDVGMIYEFNETKDVVTCTDSGTGDTILVCPLAGQVNVTATYDPGGANLKVSRVAAVVEASPGGYWLDAADHSYTAGETVHLTYHPIYPANWTVRRLSDGLVILTLNDSNALIWDLDDPFGVTPGIFVVEAVGPSGPRAYNVVMVRPYILIVRVEAGARA